MFSKVSVISIECKELSLASRLLFEVDPMLKELPLGTSIFETLRATDELYVDKTDLIYQLARRRSKCFLARPRRFGKSLNMSMLQYFLEFGCKKELFDGLEIAKDAELCEKHMGQYPVISISLKDVNGSDYRMARSLLCSVIGSEAMRFQFLLEDERLSEKEKWLYEQLTHVGAPGEASFVMDDGGRTAHSPDWPA